MLALGKHGWIALLVSLVALAWAEPAFARGSVKVTPSTVEEDEGTWKLKIQIDYGGKPDLGLVPMVFTFKQTVEYERYVDDTSPDTPLERSVPKPDAVPNAVPVDVSFSDPGTGEMFSTTKFNIKLRRDADFEAGEYDLTVKLSNGGQIGSTQKLKLKGKNKVQNRKSMDFGSGDNGPKPDPKPKPEPGSEERVGAAEDQGPDLSDIPDSSDDDGSDGGKVKPKQGGCGCRVVGAGEAGGGLALLLLGVVVAARRRRS
jgi:MYXO-CTERM domain-containing protein